MVKNRACLYADEQIGPELLSSFENYLSQEEYCFGMTQEQLAVFDRGGYLKHLFRKQINLEMIYRDRRGWFSMRLTIPKRGVLEQR